MKKIISLVLVLVLVLGTFSFAFAAEPIAAPADVTDEDQIEAVEVLMALGVVDGYTDGTYKPAKVVTRAEMAKLIISLFGYEDLVGGSAPFTDTAGHWGEGYVALASGLGLVNGYPDGTFKPDNTVSFDEAITMVVRALGYTDESLTGSWPTNYKIKGINIDLLDDVDVTGSGADRGNVALMLYNALDLTYGEVDADDVWNENTDDDGDAKTVIAKIGELVEEHQITYDDVYDGDLDTVIDLEPYLYHVVDYYENADGDVAFISNMYTIAIALDSVDARVDEDEDDEDDNVYYYYAEDSDDDDYEFNIDTNNTDNRILYNYAEGTENDDKDLLEDADLIVIYLDEEDFNEDLESANYKGISDEDGNFDEDEIVGIIATKVTDEVQVDSDYDKDDEEISVDGTDIKLPVDDDGDFDESRLVVKGDVDSVEDIEENDVVEVYEPVDFDESDEDGDNLTIIVTRDIVEGEFEEIDDDTATIDGVELDYTSFDDTTVDMLENGDLGDDFTVYLNAAGEIAFIEEYEGTVSTDYAVAVGVANGTVDTDFSDIDVDDYPQIKVFTSDEDVIIYDVDVDLDDFEDGELAVGDLELAWNGTSVGAISVTNADDFEKQLIQYEVDSDGYVTEVTLIEENFDDDFIVGELDDDDYDEPVLDSNIGDVVVVSSTLIFDISEKDEDDWEVIDMDAIDLDSDVSINLVVDADDDESEVIAMTINGNNTSEDGTYALFSKITMTTNSDDDIVAKMVGFLDGEAVTLYTDKDTDDEADDIDVDDIVLYELTIDDSEVTDIDEEDFNNTEDFVGTEEADVELTIVQAINSSATLVKVDGSYYSLDDDVIVYEVTFDDGDLDEISIVSADDIDEDDYVIMYDTDNDSDGDDDEIDVIIFISEDEAEDAGWIN